MKKINKKSSRRLQKYNLGTSTALPSRINPSTSVQNQVNQWQSDNMSNYYNSNLNGSSIGNIAGDAVGFASSLANSFSTPGITVNERTSNGPVQYLKTDYVNSSKELSNYNKASLGNTLSTVGTGTKLGATVGSVVPGVGTVVGGAIGAAGGLIGGIAGMFSGKNKLKRKIRRTNANITRKNQFNLADAQSDIIDQDYYDEYGNTQDDILYNKGKTPFNKLNKANALVGKGETIVDGNTGNMTEVTSGSAIGTDDVPAIVNPQDAVAGNKRNPITGNTFAEDIKPLTRMENKLKRNTDRNIRSIAKNTEDLVKAYTQPLANSIIAKQSEIIDGKNKAKYANGKNFLEPVYNTISTLSPTIWNAVQGMQSPDTANPEELYASNAYAQPALKRMAGRRYNINPEIEELNSLERRQRYSTRALGSEGGINRAMDLANSLAMARQISSVYAKKQNIDNEYAGQEANMMASLGAQESANKSSALRSAYDINARNKAMQKSYQQAALTGLSNYAQQQKLNANRSKMDDARLRILENYYKLGTTDPNIQYLLGSLMNG